MSSPRVRHVGTVTSRPPTMPTAPHTAAAPPPTAPQRAGRPRLRQRSVSASQIELVAIVFAQSDGSCGCARQSAAVGLEVQLSPSVTPFPGVHASVELHHEALSGSDVTRLRGELLVGGAFLVLQRVRPRTHAGRAAIADLDKPPVGAGKGDEEVVVTELGNSSLDSTLRRISSVAEAAVVSTNAGTRPAAFDDTTPAWGSKQINPCSSAKSRTRAATSSANGHLIGSMTIRSDGSGVELHTPPSTSPGVDSNADRSAARRRRTRVHGCSVGSPTRRCRRRRPRICEQRPQP